MTVEVKAVPPIGAPGMPTPDEIGDLVRNLFGALAAHTLGAAVRLGVVEAIGDGEATSAQVADACQTQPGATVRLLRAMTGLKLLTETETGTFRVTPTGFMLHSGRPGSLVALARMFTDPALMVRAWEDLTGSVRTGEPAFPKFFGKSYFDHLADQPELAELFNSSMRETSGPASELLPEHFDFSRFGTVVDVGGGDGTLLAGVLRRNPDVRGVLHDAPNGLAKSEERMRQAGVADRFTAAPGDFFASVPEGGDLYIVKGVLHDWNDERALVILGNIRKVIPDSGHLVIIEGVLPERVDPKLVGAYLNDLNMLVNHGGTERTAADFAVLIEKAGFTTPSFKPLPLPGGIFLIEATPAT